MDWRCRFVCDHQRRGTNGVGIRFRRPRPIGNGTVPAVLPVWVCRASGSDIPVCLYVAVCEVDRVPQISGGDAAGVRVVCNVHVGLPLRLYAAAELNHSARPGPNAGIYEAAHLVAACERNPPDRRIDRHTAGSISGSNAYRSAGRGGVMSQFLIRIITEDDITAADRLRQQAGWNQRPSDWLRLLRYQPNGCFVAESGGDIVGTVTTTSYERELGWIGMMLVDPEFQRQGIATALMTQALKFLNGAGIRCIKLDATPAGQHVYERLGFQPEWTFHRWTRAGRQEAKPRAVNGLPIAFEPGDLDQAAFGVSRKSYLDLLRPEARLVADNDGFGMLRSGQNADYLGPVTAESPEAASRIVSKLLPQTENKVYWDIPGPNVAAAELARSLGFEPVRDLTRMWTGQKLLRPEISLQYALADPGTG